MTDTRHGPTPLPAPKRLGWTGWRNRLAASRAFQRWASRFPLTRGFARREGEAIFDLVSGFVYSQVLLALVELRLLRRLAEGPASAAALAGRAAVPTDRLETLLRAGAAIGLLKRRRDGRFDLAQRGAALLGVPGLEAMIRHHRVLYRDLEDPVAFLRGETETELAGFWPYVFGAAAAGDPQTAQTYSDLMADSQLLVAEDVLQTVSFRGVSHLMDVGGGTGAFLAAVGAAHPGLTMTLFDLPVVVPGAEARFATAGIADRVRVVPGSFRDDPLPPGADAISLIRVLYDHEDDTIVALLSQVRAVLPSDGLLVVAEPMLGGVTPDRAGDAYFAFYCMAMRTGRTRSADQIAELLRAAGFTGIETPRPRRPFVASVVTARAGSTPA
ncbi:MAG: methyltransferase [Rhodobacter sp.]|nr:methyltransferase [Rhodobacter sp.]